LTAEIRGGRWNRAPVRAGGVSLGSDGDKGCVALTLKGASELDLAAGELVVQTDDADVLLTGTLLGLDEPGGTVDAVLVSMIRMKGVWVVLPDDQAAGDLGVEGTAVTGLLATGRLLAHVFKYYTVAESQGHKCVDCRDTLRDATEAQSQHCAPSHTTKAPQQVHATSRPEIFDSEGDLPKNALHPGNDLVRAGLFKQSIPFPRPLFSTRGPRTFEGLSRLMTPLEMYDLMSRLRGLHPAGIGVKWPVRTRTVTRNAC
jgi:hypothetical protein